MTNLAYIYGRTFSIIQIVCQVSFGVNRFGKNFFEVCSRVLAQKKVCSWALAQKNLSLRGLKPNYEPGKEG